MSDEARSRDIYQYLVEFLLKAKSDQNGVITVQPVARVFGCKDGGLEGYSNKGISSYKNKLQLLQHKQRYGVWEDDKSLGPLSANELVALVANVKTELVNQYQKETGDLPDHRIPTHEEILRLFLKLIQLTPAEKKVLGLPLSDDQSMLQQALLNVLVHLTKPGGSKIASFYKVSLDLESHLSEGNSVDVNALIKETVEHSLLHLPESKKKECLVEELIKAAKHEIEQILSQSGTENISLLLGWKDTEDKIKDAYKRRFLSPSYLRKLTVSVVESIRLSKDFPILIRSINIEQHGPQPISHHPAKREYNTNSVDSYLNESMLGLDDDGTNNVGLAAQSAYKITVTFWIKKPESYIPLFPEIFKKIQTPDGQFIEFSTSSTGIGGILSHLIKVINQAVLKDIDSLRDFFCIAHDVVIDQSIIEHSVSSPVWAHSLVKLCRSEVLAESMWESCESTKTEDETNPYPDKRLHLYGEYAHSDPMGKGDCFGFDWLQSPAEAALHARLQAVAETGINAGCYLRDLLNKVERSYLIRSAQSYLVGFPFSILAFESSLSYKKTRNLGSENLALLLANSGENINDTANRKISANDSYAAFDGYLAVIESYLREGAYRRAYSYLEELSQVLAEIVRGYNQWYTAFQSQEKVSTKNFRIFSGEILVRYLLCQANYCYLFDLAMEGQSEDPSANQYLMEELARSSPIDSTALLQKGWSFLDEAQDHLAIRLSKYYTVGEISQGVFHPHFYLLARIYFQRARYVFLFPTKVLNQANKYVPEVFRLSIGTSDERHEQIIHGARIYFLEKARLYASSDGSTERYAVYTALQASAYIMAAFLSRTSKETSPLIPSKSECMDWAHNLRNHALLSYAPSGRRYYYQIKENSGIAEELNPTYGGIYSLEPIPPIREVDFEALDNPEKRFQGKKNGILHLDTSLLCIRSSTSTVEAFNNLRKTIYLFGSNACYMMFVRGLYHLCSDDFEEFRKNPSTDAQDESETGISSVEEVELETGLLLKWDKKIERAYRLFSYSWAISEDGGKLESVESSGSVRIHRGFGQKSPTTSKSVGRQAEVDSVRDLYPHHIAEMTVFSKVFAAVCSILRIYTTTSSAKRDECQVSFTAALSDIFNEEKCHNQVLRAVLHEQARVNGHLSVYLSKVESILPEAMNEALQITLDSVDGRREELLKKRSELMRDLFSLTHQRGLQDSEE